MAAACREYRLWNDQEILIGEGWEEEIHQALAICRFGLLLISPNFLASRYITEVELPVLLNRAVFPVMLEDVDFKRHDLRGLKEKQIFRLPTAKRKQLAYGKCRTDQRRRFVEALFRAIDARLDKLGNEGAR